MKVAYQRFLRTNFDTNYILKNLRPKCNIDQYLISSRFPKVPKVILYSNVDNYQAYINNLLPFYNALPIASHSQNDEAFTRSIAEQMLNPENAHNYNGILVKGFPFSPAQALLLDRFIGGVNLAINLKKMPDPQYEWVIQPLTHYYHRCGNLVQLEYSQNPTQKQIEYGLRQIGSKIKLSQ